MSTLPSDAGLSSFKSQDILDKGFMLSLFCVSIILLVGAFVGSHYKVISRIVRNILIISLLFQCIHFLIYFIDSYESTLLDFFGPMVNGVLIIATIVLVSLYSPSPMETRLTTIILAVELAIIVGFVFFRLYGNVSKIGKSGKLNLIDHSKYSGKKPLTVSGSSEGGTQQSPRQSGRGFMAIRTLDGTFAICIICILLVVGSLLSALAYTAHLYTKKEGRLTDHPKLLNFMLSLIFLSVLLFCYYLILVLGDCGLQAFRKELVRRWTTTTDWWSYCERCSTFRPPRTIHCTECQACVLQYHHHCPWVNKCVGMNNLGFFRVLVLLFICWIVSIIIAFIKLSVKSHHRRIR